MNKSSDVMNLDRLYEVLSGSYDLGTWWPAGSKFEIMVGAILVQQTNWRNVGKVINALKERDLMSAEKIATVDISELEMLVRPVGFFRQKARRIKGLAIYLLEHHAGDPERLFCSGIDDARKELLSLDGIGNETADAILLFAGGLPKFVCATYVSRLLRRSGILDSDNYAVLQSFIESSLPPDPAMFAHFYALIVHHCQTQCRSRPVCDQCPLIVFCSPEQHEQDVP